MKRLLLSALMLGSLSVFAGTYSRSVSTSIKLIPASGQSEAVAWATGATVAAGAYIEANGTIYMSQNTGSTAIVGSGPTNSIGIVSQDNNILWVTAKSSKRGGFAVCNLSGGTVFVGIGASVTNNIGIPLASGEEYIVGNGGENVWSGEVYVFATGSVVSASEW